MNILETHFTSSICIHVRVDGIIETRPLKDKVVKIELEHAIESLAKIKEVKGDSKFILIFIQNGQINQAGRRKFQDANLGFEKVALVAEGPLQRLVGNFFLGINRPNMPIKMFSSEEKAISWFKN